MIRQTLAEWLQEITEIAKGDGGIRGLEIFHKVPGHDISQRQIPMGGSKPVDFKQLANMILGIIKNHATGTVGAQNYEIVAYKEGENEPYARRPEIANGKVEFDGNGVEAPSTPGYMGQMMRHNEGLYRATMVNNQEVFDKLLTVIELQGKQNEKLMRENHDALELAKVMILDKSSNEYAQQVEIIKMKRANEERAKFIDMIPPIVNRLTGTETFPQATEDTALINTIADNITTEQIQALGAVGLPPMLVGILMARFEQREKEKQALIKTGNPNAPST